MGFLEKIDLTRFALRANNIHNIRNTAENDRVFSGIF